VLALIFLAMWIRFTVPRFRYDQLMRFGWRVLLPIAIANIIVVATIIMVIS
jgi:NADH-quinone oxidoreductase subunit H